MSNQLTTNVVDGNLDMSDVLAVATSRAETHFTTNLAATKKEISQLQKDIEDTDEKIYKQTLADSEALVKEHTDQLTPIIAKLGGKVEVKGVAHLGKDKPGILATIEIRGHNSYGIEFRVKGEVSKELAALAVHRDQLQKQKEAASDKALEWKRRLSQIPQLERQYKAKIAESKLKKTEAGTEMLKLLTESLDQDILALPSL